ncbi:MAG: exonuclease SbcCD subunit D [Pseudomonadota bacterium]
MRVLHTSDWHLGRSLHGHSLLDDQQYVLEQLLALIRRENVELLLLAGDVYDRSVPPDGAVELFNDFLAELVGAAGVQAVVIPGNHDSALRLGFGASLLAGSGLHLLTDLARCDRSVDLAVDGQRVQLFGLPYASPERVRSVFPEAAVRTADDAMAFLLDRVRARCEPGARQILLAHCFVAGGLVSDSERPLSVGGSDQVAAAHFDGFDYVALGHLHRPHQQTRETLRYSGSLLKYSASEAGHDKGVVLFDLTGDGVRNLQTLALAPRRDLRVLTGSLAQILQAGASDPAADDYVQILLTDTQALHDVHGQLARVYPNRLQVLRPGVTAAQPDRAAALARVQRGELALFEDFYRFSAGRVPNAAEQAVLATALAGLDEPETP